MDFMIKADIGKLPQPIQYGDKILLIGSCFTEHIGNSLAGMKFNVLQNPNGILFDPSSVCRSLISYIRPRKYGKEDLFCLHEVWHSWDHHSRFSRTDPDEALAAMNASQDSAHRFLQQAGWLIITLGSSFSYRLTGNAPQACGGHPTHFFEEKEMRAVANCHRAPAQWFQKHMLAIDETVSLLDNLYHQLRAFNPRARIIFTVSPVRHLRDGIVENNRSKARLIEAVHHMVEKFEGLYYFPAYELVIDVLRDYRFYDIDLAHPNYTATSFVLEKFTTACIDSASQEIMDEVKKVMTARKHKPFHAATGSHRQFLDTHARKARELMDRYPFLDLKNELDYFESSGKNL